MPKERERNVEYKIIYIFKKFGEFDKVKSAVPVGNKEADIVLYKDQKPLIVIEVKRKDVDPLKSDVVEQAYGYAGHLGADYFATTNGKKFILFKTHKSGVGVMERKLKDFKVNGNLAEQVYKQVTEGVEWLHFNDAFLLRLRSLHETITPKIRKGLLNDLEKNENFEKEFTEWVESQGFPYEKISEKERVWNIVSNQAAYLLINKILFYKILETVYPQLPELRIKQSLNISKYLESYFAEAREINYKAVFESGIFDKFSTPLEITETLSNFIKELEDYNFDEIKKSDIIGRIYEKLIPKEKRKTLGQYYTPPKVIDLILDMTIESADDKILDPCCGSGGFLVRGYHKLAGLKGIEKVKKKKEHQDILDQLVGVEINQFPAHLSTINLQLQNVQYKANDIFVFVSDFFDIKTDNWFNQKYEMAHPNKETKKSQTYRKFDAVVANPPYIRQENIQHKEKLQKIAKEEGANLSKKSDILSYFFVHGTNFLKEHGRLGFITSNKWLEVKYGESLQEFLLENHKIEAIIEFDSGAFEDVDVNTCVTILEKESDKERRDKNTVKFVRLKEKMDVNEIIRFINSTDKEYEDEEIRLIPVKQEKLKDKNKWNIYLRAPEVYHEILDSERITELSDVADINRGETTGGNKFFFLTDSEVTSTGIPDKYLSGAIKSPKDIEGLKAEESSGYLLSVSKPKEKIDDESVLRYIETGEDKGVSERSTVKSREFWYDLNLAEEPSEIIFPYMIWESPRFILNNSESFVTDVFHEINPKEEIDPRVVCGILNSSISKLSCEIIGRSYGGGVLKMQVYETKKLPILDPRELTTSEKERIKKAYENLVEKYGTEDQEEAQRKLDNVIFDILDLSETEREQIHEAVKTAFNIRKKRKEKKVLVHK